MPVALLSTFGGYYKLELGMLFWDKKSKMSIVYFISWLSPELSQGRLEHPFNYLLVLFTPPREQKDVWAQDPSVS